jgi:pyruvate dehydrogenase E2 component (dihydrolipoamide acetyltransferase)
VADIETDKASMAFEAQDEFYIAKILVEAGFEIPVGAPMMITVEEESDVAAFANYVTPGPAAQEITVAATPVSIPAPVISAPVIYVPVVAEPIPTPVALPIPVITPKPTLAHVAAATTSSSIYTTQAGMYSVKWGDGSVAKSALSGKLSRDQQTYISQYGRSGQKPLKL